MRSRAPVGPYLVDQLLIPMALAGRSTILTSKLTAHATTNREVIEHFCDVCFEVNRLNTDCWQIRV